jgi:hypothetical protein
VELKEVDRLHLEVLQAAFHPRVEVPAAVALGRLLGKPAASLGGDEEGLALPLAPEPGHQPLAASVAVHVGGVDEVHPRVDGGVERLHGLLVPHRPPGAPDGPGPEADGRDLHVRPPELPVLHGDLPWPRKAGPSRVPF